MPDLGAEQGREEMTSPIEAAQRERERIERAFRSGGRHYGPSAEGITLWGGLSPELDAIAADALSALREQPGGGA
jgi:hypothetical protein